jgi:C1A family cysteine protease
VTFCVAGMPRSRITAVISMSGAFGTTGSIEGAHFLATKQLVALSEQQLVDCTTVDGNKGCKGGDAVNSYNYIIKNRGIDSELDYPYDIMGYDKKPSPIHPCNESKASHHNVTISSFVHVAANSEPQLAAAIAKTPVTVAVSANKLWQHYKGGIMPPNWCPPPIKENHMILAVGMAADYYIVKNSWGGGWGEKGYVRMTRNATGTSGGLCGIASQASYPVV